MLITLTSFGNVQNQKSSRSQEDVWMELKKKSGLSNTEDICIPWQPDQCEDRYLVKLLLKATKKVIARKQCKVDPPTPRNWLDIEEGIYSMERLTRILRIQNGEIFKKTTPHQDTADSLCRRKHSKLLKINKKRQCIPLIPMFVKVCTCMFVQGYF